MPKSFPSPRPRARRFVLQLVAVPGRDPIPLIRALLKIAWRSFRLRCISVEEIEEGRP